MRSLSALKWDNLHQLRLFLKKIEIMRFKFSFMGKVHFLMPAATIKLK